MARKTVGGISGVLSGITSTKHPPEQTPKLPPKPAPKTEPNQALTSTPNHNQESNPIEPKSNAPIPFPDHSTPVKTKARQGRPPGRKNGTGTHKEKATVWVSSEVLENYRDWSWDMRMPLGELMEQALHDFYKRRKKKAV